MLLLDTPRIVDASVSDMSVCIVFAAILSSAHKADRQRYSLSAILCMLLTVSDSRVLTVKGLRGQLQTVMADSVVIVMFAVAM